MREHGVIERLLLVYEDGVKRIDAGRALELEVLHETARLQRAFTEDYHERLEEQHVFPRLARAGELTQLVATLRRQHDVGREITDNILTLTRSPSGDTAGLRAAMQSYATMYIPHAAREDTVAFPALARLLSGDEQHELAERFEEMEEQRFGHDGFATVVAHVADIEERLGIGDLGGLHAGRGPDPQPRLALNQSLLSLEARAVPSSGSGPGVEIRIELPGDGTSAHPAGPLRCPAHSRMVGAGAPAGC